jgi:hypothetical protein
VFESKELRFHFCRKWKYPCSRLDVGRAARKFSHSAEDIHILTESRTDGSHKDRQRRPPSPLASAISLSRRSSRPTARPKRSEPISAQTALPSLPYAPRSSDLTRATSKMCLSRLLLHPHSCLLDLRYVPPAARPRTDYPQISIHNGFILLYTHAEAIST